MIQLNKFKMVLNHGYAIPTVEEKSDFYDLPENVKSEELYDHFQKLEFEKEMDIPFSKELERATHRLNRRNMKRDKVKRSMMQNAKPFINDSPDMRRKLKRQANKERRTKGYYSFETSISDMRYIGTKGKVNEPYMKAYKSSYMSYV